MFCFWLKVLPFQRILYLPQPRCGLWVLNKICSGWGCCTEGPGGGWWWAQLSAPEAEGAHGRGPRGAQGVGPVSLPPVPRTGCHRHCLPSLQLEGTQERHEERQDLGLPPSGPGPPSRVPHVPVLGSLSLVSGPLSSFTPSSRPMADSASSRPARSPPAS